MLVVTLSSYLTVASSCALDFVVPLLVIGSDCIASSVVFIKCSDNEKYCKAKQFPYINVKF